MFAPSACLEIKFLSIEVSCAFGFEHPTFRPRRRLREEYFQSIHHGSHVYDLDVKYIIY